MIMLGEDMLSPDLYPAYNAINHSLYGIRIQDGDRLIYDAHTGLDIIRSMDLNYESE